MSAEALDDELIAANLLTAVMLIESLGEAADADMGDTEIQVHVKALSTEGDRSLGIVSISASEFCAKLLDTAVRLKARAAAGATK